MGELSNQLKDYLENTSPEQQEKDWFNVCCKVEGIDPNDPDAEKKLRKIQRKYAWRPAIQSIKEITLHVLIAQSFMWSCIPLLAEKYLLFFGIHILGFVFLAIRLNMEKKKYEW